MGRNMTATLSSVRKKLNNKPKSDSQYDESKIKTLSPLEHIRLRTGMYIGRLGSGTDPDDGIYVLLKEVVDNSIDEYIMGHGKNIDVTVQNDTVLIRDYGRGIPLGKIIECVSVINTGAKYNDDVFQFSVGLNGVGTKAVNALSSHFKVVAYRDGKYTEATFSQGNLLSHKKKGTTTELDGTLVEFQPDQEIFGEYAFNHEFVEKRMANYACLNSGLRLNYNGQKFESKNGLLDLLRAEAGDGMIYKGCERPHWRDRMPGTLETSLAQLNQKSLDELYYHQIFFHYVLQDGERAHCAWDMAR